MEFWDFGILSNDFLEWYTKIIIFYSLFRSIKSVMHIHASWKSFVKFFITFVFGVNMSVLIGYSSPNVHSAKMLLITRRHNAPKRPKTKTKKIISSRSVSLMSSHFLYLNSFASHNNYYNNWKWSIKGAVCVCDELGDYLCCTPII